MLAAVVGISPWVQFAAIPGWGPLAGWWLVPRQLWLRVLGAVFRNSGLGSDAGDLELGFVVLRGVRYVPSRVVLCGVVFMVPPVVPSLSVFVWVLVCAFLLRAANPCCGPWVQFLNMPGLLLVVAGGPSPILAEGPGRNSPPLLAGVCEWCL